MHKFMKLLTFPQIYGLSQNNVILIVRRISHLMKIENAKLI
jgi:hypothetical protein